MLISVKIGFLPQPLGLCLGKSFGIAAFHEARVHLKGIVYRRLLRCHSYQRVDTMCTISGRYFGQLTDREEKKHKRLRDTQDKEVKLHKTKNPRREEEAE